MVRQMIIDVGKENTEYQHLEVLKRNRHKRKQYGEVFIEGVAAINALLEAGWKAHTIAFDRSRPLSGWGQEVIARARPGKIIRLAPELMQKLSDRSDPSELIVIAERRERHLAQLRLERHTLVLIFDRPTNHGNLGSIIRSADAFGATAVITVGHAVDIFDPVVIRASLGAFFARPVIHCASPAEIQNWLAEAKQKRPDFRVWGTSAEADTYLYEVDLTGPLAIVLGNEAAGMSRKLGEMVDGNLAIPMQGRVDSLNVACAGTVLLYEINRQRKTAG
ncbi:MAG TPA: RNA methyltransferase [Firmicutes bacterium]|nr:RNA methyltransferase [Bacillota bacterium]